MPPKKHIIIIGVLCVISLGLGYWYGLPKEEGSGGGGNGRSKEPEFLKKGLVAYYPFNGNAKDESGNGNDGEVNGAAFAPDRHGKKDSAYGFDGKDDVIIVPPVDSNVFNAITMSVWVKANEQDAKTKHIISCYSLDAEAQFFHIFFHEYALDGRVEAMIDDGANYPVAPPHIVSTKQISDGQWHQVTAQWSKKDGIISIYLNGKKDRLLETPVKSDITIKYPFWIGGQSSFPTRYFKGSIDDIRIYNRALSEAEVKELYEFEKPKTQQASTRQLTQEEKDVVGEYEYKHENGTTYKRVFLENSVRELYINGKKISDFKWSIVNGEIHVKHDSGMIGIWRIKQDNSLTRIADIRDGKRIDRAKERQYTWKKIK